MRIRIPFDDEVIKKISRSVVLKLPEKSKDLYFDLIESIISQQLSGRVAKTIFNRFLQLFNDQYPEPQRLIEMEDLKIRSAGLSNAKTKYVKALAEFALQNDLSIKYIDKMSDEEIISYLTRVKGIGKWTVEMVLIFSLHRPDIFPYDDLAIKKGMMELYKIDATGKELIARMNQIGERWRPNRTLSTLLIWKYLDSKKGK